MNAVILALPAKAQRAAKRRKRDVDVAERSNWMLDHASKWETVQTDGRTPINHNVQQLVRLLYEKDGLKPPTTAERHARNVANCQRIQKRNRVKAWLASLGVDMDNIKDAEQALFAAFDKLVAATINAREQGGTV